MEKKTILGFITGLGTGIGLCVILFMVWHTFAVLAENSDRILYNNPSEPIENVTTLMAFDIIDHHSVIAHIESEDSPLQGYVLFYTEKETSYYNRQLISIPEGKTVRQIGSYKWKYDKDSDERQIPIIQVFDK